MPRVRKHANDAGRVAAARTRLAQTGGRVISVALSAAAAAALQRRLDREPDLTTRALIEGLLLDGEEREHPT